ncbi:MAG: Assimilatory nitrate reductase catalytic subunit, partial [Alphaproteobacteria bacterium MarineAlpha2_Bin1]
MERINKQFIGRVSGAKDQNYTQGVICAKVARYSERVHHEERLKTPLIQMGDKGDDNFVPISWENALEEIAERFLKDASSYGSESIWPYYYGGTMGYFQRDGINRLRHIMKYSGMDKTICASIVQSGWNAGVGASIGTSPYEMSESDLIILWGTNAVSTQINVMHHITKARKNRGARLIVIDPYKNQSALVADEYLCINPGTDGALALTIMNVLIRENKIDKNFLLENTDYNDHVEKIISKKNLKWGERITGIPAKEIEKLAIEYGETDRAFIRLGYGFSRQRNGAAAVHSVSCLPSITGKWFNRGGGALLSNYDIYHLDRTLIEGLKERDKKIRNLDMSQIGRILNNYDLELKNGPPVKSMLIQNTNPLVVAPEHNLVKSGFLRKDLFVCVHDQFLTETAKLANIILPATTFFEHDDMYTGGGHSYLQFGGRVIDPIADSKSNHDVICDLGNLLFPGHPGFQMSLDELIDKTLIMSGYPCLNEFKNRKWVNCQPQNRVSDFKYGFFTEDKKFHFMPDWKNIGPTGYLMNNFPDHLNNLDNTSKELPFRLVTAPARSFLNSTFTETKSSISKEGKPKVLIHPIAAKKYNIVDDQVIKIGNKNGEVIIHSKIFDGLRVNVLVVESLWPNKHFIGGKGINVLTSADPVPPNG